MKILYCTDFSDSALYSFEKALPFLKADCEIDIISVLETGALAHLDIHPSMHKDYFDVYKKKQN